MTSPRRAKAAESGFWEQEENCGIPINLAPFPGLGKELHRLEGC